MRFLLFGYPDAITADIATLQEDARAPDYFYAVLPFPRLRALLHSSRLVIDLVIDNAMRLGVHGTQASWIKHGIDPQEAAVVAGAKPVGADWVYDPISGRLTFATGREASVRLPNENGDYRQFLQALACAVRGDGPGPGPASEAIAVMQVLEAGLQSASEQRTVALLAGNR